MTASELSSANTAGENAIIIVIHVNKAISFFLISIPSLFILLSFFYFSVIIEPFCIFSIGFDK